MPDTVEIVPSVGNGLISTQLGVGAAPGFDAIDERRFWGLALQEGVGRNAFAWAAVEDSGGVSMDIEVIAELDAAVVQGDSISSQGKYLVAPHATRATLTLDPADPTNPRVDRVVLQVYDDAHDGSGFNKAQLETLTGTPTAGADRDNLDGAAAVPDSALLIADIEVGAAVGSVSNGDIRDRRPWAVGAYYAQDPTAGPQYAPATLMSARVECSGGRVRVGLAGIFQHDGTDGVQFIMNVAAYVDGVLEGTVASFESDNVGEEHTAVGYKEITPSAGSHLFELRATVNLSPGIGLYQWAGFVEEVVRQNARNGTV